MDIELFGERFSVTAATDKDLLERVFEKQPDNRREYLIPLMDRKLDILCEKPLSMTLKAHTHVMLVWSWRRFSAKRNLVCTFMFCTMKL